MTPTAVTAIQTIAVAGIVFLGQFFVARFSKKANAETVEVDAQAKATDAWQKYAEEMKSRLDSLEKKVEEAQKVIEEDRKRIGLLERQSERDKDLIRRLLVRLRWATEEVKRLGGVVPEVDSDLADIAQLRLDITDNN